MTTEAPVAGGAALDAPVVEVGVPLPLDGPFHYSVPDALRARLAVGHAVLVPFGPRRLTGYVLGAGDAPEGRELKPVLDLVVDEPLFFPDAVPLYRWMARYYGHPLGEVLRTALPGAARTATRKVVRLTAAGRATLADAPRLVLDPELGALLRVLDAAPTGALTPATVGKRDAAAARALGRAESGGLVESSQEAVHEAVKVKTELVYALRRSAMETRHAFNRPGPVRDRLIDWLDRMGPTAQADIRDAFPSAAGILRALRDQDLVEVQERTVDPQAAERAPARTEDRKPRPPTSGQREALEALEEALGRGGFAAFLLHGVTGSGKTEVYLQTAARVLSGGGAAILLVPEIGLTPQFLARFRARFGERTVAILHSALTPRERFDEWLRIRRGEARLVVGPRSAVFAPVPDLRLIVVDEEHDGSYKQGEGLRYNARDVAMVRARDAGALAVLGSATPALETVHLAEEGRLVRLALPTRVHERPMPEVEVVDLRDFPVSDPDEPAALLSPPLREALLANHEAGGQAILLLNRRGFATTVLCTHCGVHFRCRECDVSMTYHGRRHRIVCHWCGLVMALPDACPSCGHPGELKLVGRGTERLEDELVGLWPDLRVDRMDADTTGTRRAHRRILDRFRDGGTDVLVGTQMVAKGHDFPGVTLVGVLHADAALHLPDFRAAERTFQLVSQVAGRAGRGDRPGRVLVQTWHPEHHAVRLAVEHDFEGFVERETRLRRGLWYPPFARLLMLKLEDPSEGACDRAALAAREVVQDVGARLVTGPGQMRILGPAPAPIYRVQGRFRRHVLIKANGHPLMNKLVAGLVAGGRLRAAVEAVAPQARLHLDRDPMSML